MTCRYRGWAACGALISCSASHPVLDAGYDIGRKREQTSLNPCHPAPVLSADPPVLKGARLEVAWGTADFRLVLSDRFADHLVAKQVVVILDGTTVLQAAGPDEAGVYELLRGSVEPGEHKLRVRIKARGKGWQMQGHRFGLATTRTFDATENGLTDIYVAIWEYPVFDGRRLYAPAMCLVEKDVAGG